VDSDVDVLYANCATGKSVTRLSCWWLTYHCRSSSSIWLTRSVCPSVCGWYAADIFCLVPRYAMRNCQNFEVKSFSRSEITSLGSLWFATMTRLKVYARSSVLLDSLYSRK